MEQDDLTFFYSKVDGFRILFQFTARHIQQTLIQTVSAYLCYVKYTALPFSFYKSKEFSFLTEEDEKPIVQTSYRSTSIYPYQLMVSVDDQSSSNHTLDSYFSTL